MLAAAYVGHKVYKERHGGRRAEETDSKTLVAGPLVNIDRPIETMYIAIATPADPR